MMLIRNQDQDSRAYEALVNTPRPGHADATSKAKYGGFNDYRGGGRFSGRITATFVMGGAVAKKLLRETLGIEIIAYTSELGRSEGGGLHPRRRQEEQVLQRGEVARPGDGRGDEEEGHRDEGEGRQPGRHRRVRRAQRARGTRRARLRLARLRPGEDGALHPGGEGRRVRVRVRVHEDDGHPEQRPLHDAGREALLGDQQLGGILGGHLQRDAHSLQDRLQARRLRRREADGPSTRRRTRRWTSSSPEGTTRPSCPGRSRWSRASRRSSWRTTPSGADLSPRSSSGWTEMSSENGTRRTEGARSRTGPGR